MSTRRQQRKFKAQRLADLQTPRPKLPAPKEATPLEWVAEPFYLVDIGLHKEPFVGSVPRWQAGPIIRVWGKMKHDSES